MLTNHITPDKPHSYAYTATGLHGCGEQRAWPPWHVTSQFTRKITPGNGLGKLILQAEPTLLCLPYWRLPPLKLRAYMRVSELLAWALGSDASSNLINNPGGK